MAEHDDRHDLPEDTENNNAATDDTTDTATEQELREQVRELRQKLRQRGREQAEQARERAEAYRARDRAERAEEHHDHRDERREERRGDHREDRRDEHRGPRRGGRGGFSWTSPGGPMPPFPPMPPMPPLPPSGPLPPISGAGGTFTPFDVFAGLGALFGGPGPGGHGGPGGRRRHGGRSRAGRGDVRNTVLILLYDEPANGYQLMQEIEQRTNGAWKPSSGSIYPALQQLEDEGIVQTSEGEGRKVFALTEEGRAYVREHREEWTAPWENVEPDEGPSQEAVQLRDVIAQLAMAYMQVIQVGTESQRAEASRVLVAARQSLYRILAGDSSED